MPADSDSADAVDSDVDRRLELYVRDRYPAALTETVRHLVERCAELDAAGVVDDYSLEQWPPCAGSDHVSRDDRRSRRRLVAEFEAWAAEQGYALEPAFHTQTVSSSMLDGEIEDEHVTVPLFTLALYEDGQLRGVAPCSNGRRTYTVEDGLTALERERHGAFPAVTAGRTDSSTTAEVSQE